ncbi:GGDEF domain-containing protein [Pseudomonas sp. GD04058]|uniref:GGDEF domain-containing protein n=1 Tax=Pseudomonas sp. GD04058 TaxID=2975429 RepID=UPI0024491899|nr:GGDEF domain-containing protein [Pseudomonas sp. GD04058]MDG9885831.1 GGDEF domain-containing protein [Pseudomonas sp. GD04058]
MKSLLKLHTLTFVGLAVAANLGLQVYLAFGEVKPWAQINRMDVIGEGGSGLIWLVWLVMLMRSRPAGRVSRLLAVGMACVCFSWWMDVLDEFIRLAPDAVWDNWLETAPMPVGLLLVTFGIYHLHKEQQAINAQMSKREGLFREHLLFDKLTPLGGAQYLRQHVQLALEQAERAQQPLSLVVLDIDDFSAVNLVHGEAEGDHLLQMLAQLLVLNLRQQDVLCRLAGDRFVVVMPNTGETQARWLAQELQQAVAGFAYKTLRHGERLQLRASVAAAMAYDDDVESLLRRVNLGIAKARRQAPQRGAA